MNGNEKMKLGSNAFMDMPLLLRPKGMEPGRTLSDAICDCPKCLAHGGWNLVIDFYEPGRHMKTICGLCRGVGHVTRHQAKAWHDSFRNVATSVTSIVAYNGRS